MEYTAVDGKALRHVRSDLLTFAFVLLDIAQPLGIPLHSHEVYHFTAMRYTIAQP